MLTTNPEINKLAVIFSGFFINLSFTVLVDSAHNPTSNQSIFQKCGYQTYITVFIFPVQPMKKKYVVSGEKNQVKKISVL